MYFIALTPEKQLSFLFIHLYAHIPLFYRASNISNYAERLSYSAKLAGPSQVQFYPLIRRRIQSAKRISFFSQHHFDFFSADDKNVSQGICLPMNSRPDIFILFADKPIQFYFAFLN